MNDHTIVVTPVPGMEYHSSRATGIPDFDPRTGDHLWMVVAVYRCADPATVASGQTVHMDAENLLSIEGPGCFHCEQPWTERLAQRRCKGRP